MENVKAEGTPVAEALAEPVRKVFSLEDLVKVGTQVETQDVPVPALGPNVYVKLRVLSASEAIKMREDMQGPAAKPYELKNTGGLYSCSCPAWRNQSIAIEKRTCKHLKKLRGAGIGLQNARQRLNHLYPGAHKLTISTENGQYTVNLSLYQQQVL